MRLPLTERALRVLDLAATAARQLGHDFIGSEHILLGVLREGGGVGIEALKQIGIDPWALLAEIEENIPTGSTLKYDEEIPCTPRVLWVISFADHEAKSAKQNYIGAEHILLGLIGEGEGVAAQILIAHEIDVKKMRAAICCILGLPIKSCPECGINIWPSNSDTDCRDPMRVTFPLIPLRDLVVFPHMIVPLFVGREKSVRAIELAESREDRGILLVAQCDATMDSPTASDLFKVGTLSQILQRLRLPDGTIKILVEGLRRVRICEYLPNNDYFEVAVQTLDSELILEIQTLMRTCVEKFLQYGNPDKLISNEKMMAIASMKEPDKAADAIAELMKMKIEDKQKLLESQDVRQRLELLLKRLTPRVK